MSCICGGKGLVVVQYRERAPFDIGICLCTKGEQFRRQGDQWRLLLAAHYRVALDRVQRLEELADGNEDLLAWGYPVLTPRGPDPTQAGAKQKKARL